MTHSISQWVMITKTQWKGFTDGLDIKYGSFFLLFFVWFFFLILRTFWYLVISGFVYVRWYVWWLGIVSQSQRPYCHSSPHGDDGSGCFRGPVGVSMLPTQLTDCEAPGLVLHSVFASLRNVFNLESLCATWAIISTGRELHCPQLHLFYRPKTY